MHLKVMSDKHIWIKATGLHDLLIIVSLSESLCRFGAQKDAIEIVNCLRKHTECVHI